MSHRSLVGCVYQTQPTSLLCMSALLVAIVCFWRGMWVRGFVEIKILDQNT